MFDSNSYTGKDIAEIREEIIEFIKENNKDWTDFNMSSIQLQYTEILAGVADMLCYYLDNQALETFLMTARQGKNIKNIMSTMNYKIETIGTARGEVTFERQFQEKGMRHDEPDIYVPGRFYIPKYTKIYCSDASIPPYVTLDAITMSESDIKVKLPVAQGVLVEKEIPEQVVSKNFKLYLTEQAVPIEYVEIVDESWKKVEDAFLEINGGKKYSVHTDSKDMVYILFTHNWTKYLTGAKDAKIKVRYLVSSAEDGLIESYVLDKIGEGVVDIDSGTPVTGELKVYNEKQTYGAFSKVNYNMQKANARNYLKTYDRIILLEDFETMIRKNTWVRDCVVYDWRRNEKVVPYPHQMKAWVVTVDGADVEGSQLTKLTKDLQDLTVCMTTVEVLSADFVNLDLKVEIEVAGTNPTAREKVRSKVETMLNINYSMAAFLSCDERSKLRFGMELRASVIEGEVYSISNTIEDVKVNFEDSIGLKETEFFNISSVVVTLI